MTTRLRALRVPTAHMAGLLREAWDAGDAVLPLDPSAPAGATARILELTRPATITELDGAGERRTRHLDDPLPVDDDLALVVATSGSTGRPKGVELPRSALTASTVAGLDRLGCVPGQRWALALPTHHVAGLQVILRAWQLGTEPIVVAGASELAEVAAEHVALVPTQLVRLLDAGADVARFRSILLGGGMVHGALLDRARAAGATVVVSYGMTETCGGCVYDGVALDGVEVELDEGDRIRLRGPVLFRRYRADDAATRAALDADGWFTTGDVGRLDGGRLTVLGRADDVIVSGGENIPAASVTTTLLGHPDVADAAVIGRPDPEWGERVVAVVVPRDATSPPDLAALRAHVGRSHPTSAAPRELVLVATLPRDAMGKVTPATLRSVIAGRS